MTQLNVGDIVTLPEGSYSGVGGGSYSRYQVVAGQNLRITRVYSSTAIARGLFRGEERSISIWHHSVVTVNGVDPETGVAPVPPRPLGQKPEDSSDVPFTYIDVSDPGIQWLFEDMAKFADGKSWCSQCDELAAALGIPGRPQEWDVELDIDNIVITASITAGSLAEATNILRSRLAASLNEA